MKPNYLVIGSAKCATTSLCRALGAHPQVFMAPRKELDFFSRDSIYARGIEWYESQFEAAGDRPLRGEGSPRYTVRLEYPEAARRIVEYSPDFRLIYIVRHPLRRIESLWQEMRRWSGDRLRRPFHESLEHDRHWLLDSTAYWREIGRYRDRFPDSRIQVVFFEDFQADPAAVTNACLEFLGASPWDAVPSGGHLNRTADKTTQSAVLLRAHELPGFGRLTRLVPRGWKAPLRRALRQRADAKPRWTKRTRERVFAELLEDTHRFLDFYGKPRDYWDLAR